ncbi:chloroquine resistance transporter, putative [Plasmodium relictum]|uniref:Chloroquine resistance transporter, putative n=1 Tax=Plasmodium relictum TaxID=85471 RepID=A0A1J1H0V3_PLARL|nr:chloroquine resistance transporter, putative [Plasmodium relictum]CRG98421.1 chloroquine resistance transporter, putative [Plasmodium relictum]
MTINSINSQNDSNKKDEHYKELDTLLEDRDESQHNRISFLTTLTNWGNFVFYEIKNNISIYILSLIYLCVCVMNKVFAKRTMNIIGNYSFVTSEIHNTICVFVFFMVHLFFNKYDNYINNRRKVPIINILLISLLDASTVIISFIGLTRTTGNMQSFALQLSIPINMFFCFLILKYRYHLLNYLGALIIVATIATVEMKMSMETQEENSIIFNLIFISSLIPLCFSSMTREIVFKKYKINILKLNAIVSLFQIFTTCLILPVYTLPFLKQAHLPFSEIPVNIKNGFSCLFWGKNTVVENCGYGMPRMCDNCEGAWKTFITYSFFNICDNLVSSYIINKFSTMTYTIVSCIQGPAIAIAYYFKFIAGDAMRKPRILDFLTLFGYLCGSIIYRTGNIILEGIKAREEDDEESMIEQ